MRKQLIPVLSLALGADSTVWHSQRAEETRTEWSSSGSQIFAAHGNPLSALVLDTAHLATIDLPGMGDSRGLLFTTHRPLADGSRSR